MDLYLEMKDRNMYTFTRWLDNKLFTLEEVEKLLIMDHPDDIPGSGAQYLNWKIVKVFPENKSGMFNGRQITYNYYSFSVDQIPGGSEPMDDGTYTKSGFVIPYFSSGRVRYIISRNTYAQTFLRKMLFFFGKGEVVSNAVEFSGDMFVWLISKVYSGETVFSNESDFLDDLGVDSIKGFKGNTEDLLAKVTVTGESVMNILSALSFLIESRNLNQITIDLSYRRHLNMEILLNNRNTIGFNEDSYIGELNQKPREEVIATCLILLYTEILPIIIQKYQSDIDENLWGQGKCVEFLKRVAADLNDQINTRINDLVSRPEQLRVTINPEDNSISI